MKALDLAIKHIGGVGKLAAAIGVGQAVVSNWRARDTVIDPLSCTAIETATNGVVTRQILRPKDWQKIWPELAAAIEAAGKNVVLAGDALGYDALNDVATKPELKANVMGCDITPQGLVCTEFTAKQLGRLD